MKPTIHSYIIDSSFVSPLGLSTDENFKSLLEKRSGIRSIGHDSFFPKTVLASVIGEEIIAGYKKRFGNSTRFDSLLMACLQGMHQKNTVDYSSPDTLVILSTTKGNVELLSDDIDHPYAALHYSAKLIQQYLKNPNQVMIVSNACISGISASITANRYLKSGKFTNVLVIGCDVISTFVLSGFSSFKAISKKGCKPFDVDRDGVVLGEACGAILYSSKIKAEISIVEGFISNDANHISGPSRTGEELAYCIRKTMQSASVKADDIHFIAAHGTATVYNDEMESKAIDIAGLSEVPLFSVKAHLGHTLGASGVIETIISAECMKRNLILPSMGFAENGVSGNITVNQSLLEKEIQYALKTTSGFGGCNAAMLMKKSR